MLNELTTELEFDTIEIKGKSAVYNKEIKGKQFQIKFETRGWHPRNQLISVSFTIDGWLGIRQMAMNSDISITVFALVEKAINAYVSKFKPKQLSFYSVDQHDKAKIKLFDRLAWKFAKKYGYLLVKNIADGDVIYYFRIEDA